METVRQGFQAFSNRVRGFFGGLLSRSSGLCQSPIVSVSAPVDLSGTRLVDISGVDLSGSVVTTGPVTEEVKATSTVCSKAACEIEDSAQCKGCDCSVNTCKKQMDQPP
jgi:hypothetical protein